MGGRNSLIRRGAQLNNDLQNYIEYMSTPRTPNVGTGGDRPDQISLFITPFALDIETDERVHVQSSQEGHAALSSYLVSGNGAEIDTTLGTNKVANIGNFRPAKVVWFRNASKSKTVVTSKVTKRPYLKYAGTRDSCAFGRAAATDDLVDVFNAIKADVRANNASLAVNRVSLTREKVSL